MDAPMFDKAVASLIEKAVNGIDTAVAFGSAELPEVIRSLLEWKTTVYSIRIVLFGLIVAAIIWWVIWNHKEYWRQYAEYCAAKDNKARGCWCSCEPPGDCFWLQSALVVVAFVCLIVVVANVANLLQILIAPKVWLLEYAKDLLGG